MEEKMSKRSHKWPNLIHETLRMFFVAILRHPGHTRELEKGLFWSRTEQKPI